MNFVIEVRDPHALDDRNEDRFEVASEAEFARRWEDLTGWSRADSTEAAELLAAGEENLVEYTDAGSGREVLGWRAALP